MYILCCFSYCAFYIFNISRVQLIYCQTIHRLGRFTAENIWICSPPKADFWLDGSPTESYCMNRCVGTHETTASDIVIHKINVIKI